MLENNNIFVLGNYSSFWCFVTAPHFTKTTRGHLDDLSLYRAGLGVNEPRAPRGIVSYFILTALSPLKRFQTHACQCMQAEIENERNFGNLELIP